MVATFVHVLVYNNYHFAYIFPLILFLQCGGVESLEAIAKVLADVISQSKAWILDVDLDFYSTGNPYRDLFTSVSNAFQEFSSFCTTTQL